MDGKAAVLVMGCFAGVEKLEFGNMVRSKKRVVAALVLAAVCVGIDQAHAHVGPSGYVESAAVAGGVIQEFSLSPDGTRVAEVVTRADAGNSSRIVIRALDNSGNAFTTYRGAAIGSLIWLSNRRVAFVKPGAQGGIVEQDIQSRKTWTLHRGGSGIGGLLFDSRSRSLAYEYTTVPALWNGRVSLRVTADESTLQFLYPKWAQFGVSRAGVLRLNGELAPVSDKLLPVTSATYSYSELLWKNGHLLMLKASWKPLKTDIVDTTTSKSVFDQSSLCHAGVATVSSSGRIAVTARGLWTGGRKGQWGCAGPFVLYVMGDAGRLYRVTQLATPEVIYISHLWWAGRDRLLAQILGADTPGGAWNWKLVEVDWRRNRVVRVFRWPNGDLGSLDSTCSLDQDRSRAMCVAQTLVSPPKLVEVNLHNGAMRVLGPVNPSQRKLDFRFRTVRIKTSTGGVATGFLAAPPQARVHAVPLAVMLYGFDREYSRDAQWITSYPVARLVHSGIAVLLLNWAYNGASAGGGLKSTMEGMHSTKSLLANAVPAVKATGLTISRAMIMGWSFGGLYAARAIQNLPEYVAAQVGDPAAWTSTGYVLGIGMFRHVLNAALGGPPTGKYLKNYAALDPVGDGKPAHGPILLEFVSRHPNVGQYLSEWQAAGTPVEAFVYRRSVHWLNVPAEARISRERNLDWAKLNLLGPQSVSAAELRRVGLTVPKDGWWTRVHPQ